MDVIKDIYPYSELRFKLKRGLTCLSVVQVQSNSSLKRPLKGKVHPQNKFVSIEAE